MEEGEDGAAKAAVQEQQQRPFNYDVVNVSQGFLLRTAYKKVVKASKLDGFLERRVKQHLLEERQRQERRKQASLTLKAEPTSTSTPAPTPTTPIPLIPTLQIKTEVKPTITEPVVKTDPMRTEGSGLEASGTTGSSKLENQTLSQGEEKGALPPRTNPLGPLGPLSQPADTTSDSTSTGQPGTSTPSLARVTTEQQQTQNLVAPIGAPSSTSQATPPPGGASADGSGLQQGTAPDEPKPASGSVEVTEENGKSHKLETSGQSVKERNSADTDAPVPSALRINGRDADMETELVSNSLAKNQPSTLSNCTEAKVNSLCPAGEGKLPLKDPLRPLLNGDTAPDGEAERTPTHASLQVSPPPSVSREDSGDMPPLKIPKLSNSLQDSAPTLVTSTEHNSTDTERLKSEVMTPKTIGPTPSAADSSLSSVCAEGSGAGGSADSTVVTQVTTTTTTTTVSTESRMVRLATAAPGSVAAVVSSTEKSAVSTLSTSTKTMLTQVSSLATRGQTDSLSVSQERTTRTTSSSSSSTLKGSSVSVTTTSHEHSTRERVRLLKFSRTKKARSGTALPSYRKFVTKSCKKSIFVLPNDDLYKLGRRAGIREVSIFSYNAKPALDIWPYPSPRPTYGITWR